MDKPPLWELVNSLYHGVMDRTPQVLQDRDMSSAFVLGAAGTYGAFRGIRFLLRNFGNYYMPTFGDEWLPKIEKGVAAAMTAVPILYAAVDPEGAKQIMTMHPTYTSGMMGVWAGGVGAIVHDMFGRRTNDVN